MKYDLTMSTSSLERAKGEWLIEQGRLPYERARLVVIEGDYAIIEGSSFLGRKKIPLIRSVRL